MRFPLITAALAAFVLAVPAAAQDKAAPKVNGMATSSTRAETRLMVATPDFSTFAMASLTYGQPEWQAKYDAGVEKLEVDGMSVKGKTLRLGKDWFTTLITSSDLEIGGTKIPTGSYVVGLHCDKDGKFSLALMDSTKAMQTGANPFMDWKPELSAPLTLNKGGAKESAAKMTMTFDAKQDDGGKGTFTLAWGKHTLTAPCQLHAPKK